MAITAIYLTLLFIAFMFLFTIPLNIIRRFIPAFISMYLSRILFFGTAAYKNSETRWLSVMEIPKKSFRHFYNFAACFSSACMVYMVLVYFYNVEVSGFLRHALDKLVDEDEPATVITSVTAMFFLTLHCWRRMYESNFMQVFSKSGKMNVIIYIGAYIFYSACMLAVMGKSPLFCGSQTRTNMTWIDLKTILTIVPGTTLFFWAFYEQHRSHKILANLRKSKDSDVVVTETHKIPIGGLFRYVSSPHRLCETMIYMAFLLILQSKPFVCIFLFVLSNQTLTAVKVQEWYKQTFKNYPSDRYAIFPYLL